MDPATLRKRTVRVGAVPFDVLAAYTRVWVTAWEAGRLVEVDPRSLKILRRTRIGPRPAGLRAASGAVWVGFGRSATAVARVDPSTRRIERVLVGVRSPNWFVAGTRGVDPRTSAVVDSFPAGPGRVRRAPGLRVDVGCELRGR